MKITCVKSVFFSATGNTKYVVNKIAKRIAEKLHSELEIYDFTLAEKRVEIQKFQKEQIVIFGVPVYAGRVPNKLLPFIQTHLEGNDAFAVPIVTFGNRNYDNALIELRNELEKSKFHTIAGAAFVSKHAFSNKIASDRPNKEDNCIMDSFADAIADKIKNMKEITAKISVKGVEPIPQYYTPLGIDGKPVVFIKAKPKTKEYCTDCKICAQVCPMSSINYNNPSVVDGICIKCQACIKACPINAKYFDDTAFLSHVAMLEQNYIANKENEIFI